MASGESFSERARAMGKLKIQLEIRSQDAGRVHHLELLVLKDSKHPP
jgi:hypothetical protein